MYALSNKKCLHFHPFYFDTPRFGGFVERGLRKNKKIKVNVFSYSEEKFLRESSSSHSQTQRMQYMQYMLY